MPKGVEVVFSDDYIKKVEIMRFLKPVLLVSALTLLAPVSQAQVFSVFLNGPSEAPPNPSLGVGTGFVVFNTAAHTMFIQVSFSGLTGTTTASHIHAPTAVAGVGNAGVATETPTFGGFPLGVTSGSYTNTYDMTLLASYNGAFITANGGTAASAETALVAAAVAGKSYLNIHTNLSPGGEIRGFLLSAPEPGTGILALIGLGALIYRRKRS